MERFDVVVVGAGLAGLWCSRELARRGVNVLLVDAKAAVDRPVQTTGIFVRRTLEDFALPPVTLGRPIRRVALYSPRRRQLVLESRHDEFRIADMPLLYRILLADCQRFGVSWSPLTRYTGLRRSSASLTVEFGARTVQATFIVGADGARSRVATDLRLSRNRSFIVGVEEVYEDVTPASPPTLHCILDPALAPGYIAWVAHDGSQAHVGTAGDPQRFHPQRALKQLSADAAELIDLGRGKCVERRAGLIPVNGVLPHLACSRGLLIGDAAGAPSPLTAGGIDPCLRLSDFAADLLAQSVAARNADPLCRYDGRRFSARFAARRWMRAFFESCGPMTLELACALLRTPIARRLAEHVFFGRGSFPEPARTAPRLSRAPYRYPRS
ncbi:MAG: NAD(P)/FAD-dependent oxidoreductase [Candidatus Eremiobacteraeota bacterium]|nr:NAD(P)/FAD-dependent oxidoreductase [Candidatus Eremiobacteraeota bacterium]